ncbi:hypothetical protein CONPUDRAFT_111405 [Coniophora puteana RWD-64-598 SS2]|uniref:CCHC-type domain-containing protein n=1 Tax=Coniophora puteana (strain RWD-64-598) TaxID=741705 RepID=A0A5M3MAZ0_CONPW|nr:uncharacterized protein CONPUDRAFT_111405 [Coniophora puteana RWD-64-598 SS2]EIW76442.1 hypothetical protein CONPUDRAFT_111405 [Coniophora puteana RWD-64-598 SS2]
MRKIQALKQTGSCAAYAARFRELLPLVDFSPTTQLDQFKNGLKLAVRDLVRGVRPKPKTFDEYVALAIEFDNDLHEDELAAKHMREPPRRGLELREVRRTAPPSPRPSTSAAASSDVVPMEVDAVKFRGPLSQEEKDRRKRLGLCDYCGQGKHSADDCPNKSDKAKRRDAERKAALAKAGKA